MLVGDRKAQCQRRAVIVMVAIALVVTDAAVAESPRSQDANSRAQFVEELQSRGFAVEPGGELRQPFLTPVGELLTLNGDDLTAAASVQTFVYEDAAAAEAELAEIGPDGHPPGVMISWVSTPNFYRAGDLVVLYVGTEPALLDHLDDVLGGRHGGDGESHLTTGGTTIAATRSVRSPFRAFAPTRDLASALARRAGYRLGYEVLFEREAERGQARASAEPAYHVRMRRDLDGDLERVVDVLIDALPGGGWEIMIGGDQRAMAGFPASGELLASALPASGADSAGALPPQVDEPAAGNPDLEEVDGILGDLIAMSGEGASDLLSAGLEYVVYQLSYVQADRALGLLKALGYQTVEYDWTPGLTDFDGIFDPREAALDIDQVRLPAVVHVLDSGGQTLQEFWDSGYGGGTESRSMAQVTSGEPMQRLLLVYAPEDLEAVERLMNLLRDDIDVAARQVVIEAQVVEINVTSLEQLGVSFNGGFGTQSLFNINPADGPSFFTFDENGLDNPFQATLTALVEEGDAEVLSNPSVMVLDGRQARIEIGQLIPVATSESTGVGFSTSVRNERVGIMLNLRPRVSEDGDEVTLQVETDVSALIAQITQRDANGNILFTAPQVDERRVESFVRIANNTPFIIGGLVSTELEERTSGVPILKDIPGIGLLFKRTSEEAIKKEVIIVLTPHVVPVDEKSFRFAIPKSSDLFDSFGHRLFRNSYRIRPDDAFFDLDDVKATDEYRDLVRRVEAHVSRNPSAREHPGIAAVLDDRVPGEEVLVHRMIWEIVRDTGYGDHVEADRIIYFENNPAAADGSGFELRFLRDALARRDGAAGAVIFAFDGEVAATLDSPLADRNAYTSYERVPPGQYDARLREGNAKSPSGDPLRWSVILSDRGPEVRAPLQLLRDVVVMRRILDLNPTLELSLDGFRPGREIIFPTEEGLRTQFHVIDETLAKYFYEASHYYAAFQAEYRRQRAEIEAILVDGR